MCYYRCACLEELADDQIDNFIPQEVPLCNAPCPGNPSQLCGGRDVSKGYRFASIYRSVDTYSETANAPPSACELHFYSDKARATAVFPSHGTQGTLLHVLVDGLRASVTDQWTNETRARGANMPAIQVCGRPCRPPGVEVQTDFLRRWASGEWNDVWADEVPNGVYGAVPLLCISPDCDAGFNDVVLIDPVIGVLGAPVRWRSDLIVTGVEVLGATPSLANTPLSTAGGTLLQLVGVGFSAVAHRQLTITIGSAQCEALEVNYTHLECRTHAGGEVDGDATVEVASTDDFGLVLKSSFATQFAFTEPPAIGAITPAEGSAAGGLRICIEVSGLAAAMPIAADSELPDVHFSEVECKDVAVTAGANGHPDSVCCTTPAVSADDGSAPGAVPVRIRAGALGYASPNTTAGVFHFNSPPTFRLVEATSGYEGLVMKVLGAGFGCEDNIGRDELAYDCSLKPRVEIGGIACPTITSEPTSIRCVVPHAGLGKRAVTVFVPGIGHATIDPTRKALYSEATNRVWYVADDDGGQLLRADIGPAPIGFEHKIELVSVQTQSETSRISFGGGIRLQLLGIGFHLLHTIPQLAEGWMVVNSALDGTYYRQTATGRTQWSRPTDGAPIQVASAVTIGGRLCTDAMLIPEESIERHPPTFRPAPYSRIECIAPPLYNDEAAMAAGQQLDVTASVEITGASCAAHASCEVIYTEERTPVVSFVRPESGGAGTIITSEYFWTRICTSCLALSSTRNKLEGAERGMRLLNLVSASCGPRLQ